MKKTLIIIPAYNEEKNIGAVLDGIRDSQPDIDVVVVNDGSSDQTGEVARSRTVTVLNHTFNLGYGGALQTGFRFALSKRYEYVVTMDGDGQHDSSSIKNLFEAQVATGANVVLGTRFLSKGYEMGAVRSLGVALFRYITRLYTGIKFTDPTSGFQLLDKSVFSYLSKGDNYPMDYPDANTIILLHRKKFKVVEAQVNMFQRREGTSMHSGLKPIGYVMKMMLAIIMVVLRRD
ncbi:MAG: glycosyltransferase family 2 protein [Nitrospirae bacterium]|nr:glycosyltransferase family 2 protein [Nitrospirota bacterium]MBF0533932.1 glycosyltransferase family 2 protein [Nitrospirota bacterium]MBF0618030.1 glycosyltransferase family 2 protein [Nitrospirota bacterium]